MTVHIRSIHIIETHPRADMRVARQRRLEVTAQLRDEVDDTPLIWPSRKSAQVEAREHA